MPIAARLDELGKPAWIAVVILGFVIWWPVGLAALGYVIWSGRMGCWNKRAWQRGESMGETWQRWSQPQSSGNKAFDEYRMETLRRLEEEQREFKDFLERLRMAKDKAEFDQFMADRRSRPAPEAPAAD